MRYIKIMQKIYTLWINCLKIKTMNTEFFKINKYKVSKFYFRNRKDNWNHSMLSAQLVFATHNFLSHVARSLAELWTVWQPTPPVNLPRSPLQNQTRLFAPMSQLGTGLPTVPVRYKRYCVLHNYTIYTYTSIYV